MNHKLEDRLRNLESTAKDSQTNGTGTKKKEQVPWSVEEAARSLALGWKDVKTSKKGDTYKVPMRISKVIRELALIGLEVAEERKEPPASGKPAPSPAPGK